jgi:glycosyltransferase involved in cell wall biosynthesis
MSPRVTYWTGTWDPAKEAISKEVNALRVGPRSGAPVVSFAPHQATRFVPRDRALCLSGRAWPILRVVAAVIERRGDVTHIFGGAFSWHLFRALGKRPILLTAVAPRIGDERLPHTRIARVAIEVAAAADEWVEAGVPRERVEVVPPGVDLEWYRPAPPPSTERFTLLFASTPSDASEIGPRGVPLLVELARLRPDLDVILPWRQWGDLETSRRALEALRPPSNVVISVGDADMRDWYARAHATIVCFDRGVGKACPNFVLEGFACGRPCIATPEVGIAGLIETSGSGIVARRDARALAEAADRLRTDWTDYAERARALANDRFDMRRFRARYEQIYRDIASEAARA